MGDKRVGGKDNREKEGGLGRGLLTGQAGDDARAAGRVKITKKGGLGRGLLAG